MLTREVTLLVGIGVEAEAHTVIKPPARTSGSGIFAGKEGYAIGRTPIGRVTIEVLNMDAILLVAFRERLIERGVFPPE